MPGGYWLRFGLLYALGWWTQRRGLWRELRPAGVPPWLAWLCGRPLGVDAVIPAAMLLQFAVPFWFGFNAVSAIAAALTGVSPFATAMAVVAVLLLVFFWTWLDESLPGLGTLWGTGRPVRPPPPATYRQTFRAGQVGYLRLAPATGQVPPRWGYVLGRPWGDAVLDFDAGGLLVGMRLYGPAAELAGAFAAAPGFCWVVGPGGPMLAFYTTPPVAGWRRERVLDGVAGGAAAGPPLRGEVHACLDAAARWTGLELLRPEEYDVGYLTGLGDPTGETAG